MQILKGDNFKSITVEAILRSRSSYCFVYYEEQLPFEHYYINSKVANINQLQGYLQEFIDYKMPEISYDYVIIYTNKTEEEISNLLQWLKGKELDFNCRCILVTCK